MIVTQNPDRVLNPGMYAIKTTIQRMYVPGYRGWSFKGYISNASFAWTRIKNTERSHAFTSSVNAVLYLSDVLDYTSTDFAQLRSRSASC